MVWIQEVKGRKPLEYELSSESGSDTSISNEVDIEQERSPRVIPDKNETNGVHSPIENPTAEESGDMTCSDDCSDEGDSDEELYKEYNDLQQQQIEHNPRSKDNSEEHNNFIPDQATNLLPSPNHDEIIEVIVPIVTPQVTELTI